jgi:hypothetical protein
MNRITTRKRVELLVREIRKKGEKPNAGPPKRSRKARTLEEAMLIAAAESQQARDNGGGLIGYFMDVARNQPALMARFIYRLMLAQEKELAGAARQQKHR